MIRFPLFMQKVSFALALSIGCIVASDGLHAAAPTPANEPLLLTRDELAKASGEQIYRHVCQGCHMAEGQGAVGAGHYPALAGDANLASARYAATIVLHGRNDMPAFAMRSGLSGFEAMVSFGLSDVQVADVINYIRTHFGNHYEDAISADDVRAMHPEEKKESP